MASGSRAEQLHRAFQPDELGFKVLLRSQMLCSNDLDTAEQWVEKCKHPRVGVLISPG